MPDTRVGADWLDGVVPPNAAAAETQERPATTVRHPSDEEADKPPAAPPQPEPHREPEPHQPVLATVAHFFGMSVQDRADRKARGNGKGWWMRWMGEQPASVDAHLYYYLHERHRRRDGRKGWDLDTNSPLVNGVFALLYRTYGLTVGLVFGCLVPYASAWIHQRPDRALLALALWALVWWNVVGWLVAHVCKG